jgi:hypothetical protein
MQEIAGIRHSVFPLLTIIIHLVNEMPKKTKSKVRKKACESRRKVFMMVPYG